MHLPWEQEGSQRGAVSPEGESPFLPLLAAPSLRAHLEEPLHVLQRCILSQNRVGVAAHHVIDGLHDGQHLLRGSEGRAEGLA